jgi:hypothetical protein
MEAGAGEEPASEDSILPAAEAAHAVGAEDESFSGFLSNLKLEAPVGGDGFGGGGKGGGFGGGGGGGGGGFGGGGKGVGFGGGVGGKGGGFGGGGGGGLGGGGGGFGGGGGGQGVAAHVLQGLRDQQGAGARARPAVERDPLEAATGTPLEGWTALLLVDDGPGGRHSGPVVGAGLLAEAAARWLDDALAPLLATHRAELAAEEAASRQRRRAAHAHARAARASAAKAAATAAAAAAAAAAATAAADDNAGVATVEPLKVALRVRVLKLCVVFQERSRTSFFASTSSFKNLFFFWRRRRWTIVDSSQLCRPFAPSIVNFAPPYF